MSNTVYGKNSFVEALNSNRITKAYVLGDSNFIKDLKDKKIDFEIVNKNKLDKLSKNGNHQGCLAMTKEYKLSSIDKMLKKENGLIVMLDGLKDPHNLGAIIRTCECAGVDGVIYKKHNSVHINETVAKVACGALEYVKVAEVNNLVSAIEELKKTDESSEVFKQAGNLLIKVEYKQALDEAEEKLETFKLRKQTMARQEERVMKKLEEMQTNIQAAMNGLQGE